MRNESLLNWLKKASQDDIEKTGTSIGYLRNIGYGYKKASPALAVQLERLTEGQITRKDLRPEDWREIWPELNAA